MDNLQNSSQYEYSIETDDIQNAEKSDEGMVLIKHRLIGREAK
jgi:hypothetical protein